MSIISWDEFVRQQKGEYQRAINPVDLRLGDFVVSAESDGSPFNLPPGGFLVEDFEQKKWLQGQCTQVTIDLARSLNRQKTVEDEITLEALPRLPDKLDALKKARITSRGVVDAWQVYRELSLCSQGMVLSFSRHGRVDVEGILRAVKTLEGALKGSLAELIWLTHIKEGSRYLYQHGLNVAILASAFCHAAGWSQSWVQQSALAGLLHGLGKVRLPPALINKVAPLKDDEVKALRRYGRLGHDVLIDEKRVPVTVTSAVLSHTERADGSGYPLGLKGEEIPVLARLLSIVGAYDAMTSSRPHQKATSHQGALGVLWRERDKQFDKKLVEVFSEFLGWATPGCLLKLPDGGGAICLDSRDGQSLPAARRLVKADDQWQFGKEIALEDIQNIRLMPDGVSGVSVRALTRFLPKLLAVRDGTSLQGSLGKTSAVIEASKRRERRRRTRIDAPRGSHILVVDDSSTIRQALMHMLGQAGYGVRGAETGEEAIEMAEALTPDLIFLDIVLPGMSGFSALRKLRKMPSTQQVPIVMISGNSRAADQFFLERVGADDFIHKPFGRLEVFSCIERLVRSGLMPLRPGQVIERTAAHE